MNHSVGKTLLSLSLLALISACGGKDGKPAGAGGPGGPGANMPPPEVEVITMASGSATLTQDLPGRVQAFRTAQVRARVEGVVERRLFEEGSEVKAGTPLFRIDARTYRANAEAARAERDFARQTVERYQPLLEIKAVSKQEYDLAAARFKQTEAALIRAQQDLDNASAPAPIAGRIGRAQVTEGALVGRGEATLLATVEQLDTVYINFSQPGADVLRLRRAVEAGKLRDAGTTTVQLVLEDGSIYPQPGKLFFSDLATDPSTGAVSLRAEVPNPKRELLPGMFVRVRFPQAQADNVMRVPQRAVQAGQQGQFVIVVGPESKATPQPITTGGMAGTDFIVSSGLKGGEQVIVNGLQKARPGTVVVPKPFGAPAPAAPEGEKKQGG